MIWLKSEPYKIKKNLAKWYNSHKYLISLKFTYLIYLLLYKVENNFNNYETVFKFLVLLFCLCDLLFY